MASADALVGIFCIRSEYIRFGRYTHDALRILFLPGAITKFPDGTAKSAQDIPNIADLSLRLEIRFLLSPPLAHPARLCETLRLLVEWGAIPRIYAA